MIQFKFTCTNKIRFFWQMSIHQASHFQKLFTERFFINNTVETTERSRSLYVYFAEALNFSYLQPKLCL